MSLPQEMKIIRQTALLTQEAFAQAIDVAFSTVNRWESGKARPGMAAMQNIKRFCEKRDISFEALQESWLKQSKGDQDGKQ